jgi:hypothetical protein
VGMWMWEEAGGREGATEAAGHVLLQSVAWQAVWLP